MGSVPLRRCKPKLAGENSIVIVGGANAAAWEFSPAAEALLAGGAGMVLLQREVPEDVNLAAAKARYWGPNFLPWISTRR